MSGIFPITDQDGSINRQSGVMMVEAMYYTVDLINNDPNYLNGYQLGIDKMFDAGKITVRDAILTTFIDQVPFLIGPYSSETSYIGSILTGTFKQIAFSYSATYSDFDPDQEYMVRTVPSDTFRIQAAVEVTKRLKWNYIGIISSYGYNGERDALHFTSKISKESVCLANQVDLSKEEKEEGYINAISAMSKDKRLKAIVLFTTTEDSKALMMAIKRLNLKDRFYIFCIYGCTNYFEVVKGHEDIAEGIISLDLHNAEDPGFKKYFLSLKPADDSPVYFLDFWEDVFNCSLPYNPKNRSNSIPLCTGNEELSSGKGYYPLTPVNTVIDAVHSISAAIRIWLAEICSEEKMRQINETSCIVNPAQDTDGMNRHLLKKIPKFADGTVRLDTSTKNNNEIRYDIHQYTKSGNVFIGHWSIKRTVPDLEKARFLFKNITKRGENGSRTQMQAKCSHKCPPGHIRNFDTNIEKQKCCWTCRKCPDNCIAANDTCIRCKETEKTNENFTSCLPLPRRYINLNRTEAWVFFMFSIIGLMLVCFVAFIFIRYNNNHIVRSSGRDLCYLILFGICLTFLCPFTFLTKPSTQSCLFRGALPGLAFICCYAPLFLRTNRIYRIFIHAKTSVARPSLVSAQSQLMVSFGIVAIQFLLVVVWFVAKMPSPEETVSVNKFHVNIHCKTSPIILVLNLALSVIFMVLCTVLAFKTRHFPKNYNEAKYIGITLYLSCVAWAVFFPGYFLTNPKAEFLREYLMSAISVVIGYITLFGLFGRKVGMLLFGVPKGMHSNSQTPWNLSEHDSDDRGEVKLLNGLKSVPTTDMLLQD